MQRLDVSGAVRPLEVSLGVKGLNGYLGVLNPAVRTPARGADHSFSSNADRIALCRCSSPCRRTVKGTKSL